MSDKILLIDDEKDIVDLLEEVLRKEGFEQIQRAYEGEAAVMLCRDFQPDIMILDVMLPGLDGIEVCKKVREFSHCSILFLSSKSDDIDKILGLAAGGDDYIAKPFSPKEMVYRIKAQLRRMQYAKAEAKPLSGQKLQLQDLTIDPDACCAYKKDQLLELTAKEYGILLFLMENHDKIISKERLYEQVWGEESAICDNTIMVHLRHLREKIEEDASNPKLLITIKGLGYKLISGEKR